MKEVFQKVFSIEEDDALKFDIDNTVATNITEFKEYHGVNISTVAYLDRTRIPISIDIGFGDVVVPEKVKMDYPVLLDMDSPVIYVYSKESIIAEKFEAIVQLGYGNGRLKDFYDIQLLAMNFDFDGTTLKKAIIETFNHRNTLVDDSYLYDSAFIEDALLKSRSGYDHGLLEYRQKNCGRRTERSCPCRIWKEPDQHPVCRTDKRIRRRFLFKKSKKLQTVLSLLSRSGNLEHACAKSDLVTFKMFIACS